MSPILLITRLLQQESCSTKSHVLLITRLLIELCGTQPSFVSGEYLVCFDPHAKFLPGATLQHPGLRIKFTRSNILSQFPDQFKPYLMLGCDLENEYKGTLFRFPLRDVDSAKNSEIKTAAYNMDEVNDLVQNFRRLGPDALLFLKHIRNIKIYELESEGADLKLLYQMSARTDPPEDMSRFLTLPSFVEGTASAPVSKDQFFQMLRKCKPDQLPQTDMTVDILKTEGELVLTERWAILSALGGGEAKLMAVDPSTAHLRLVPWAGVATLLQRDGLPAQPVKGRAFCFLPLPAETGLPVHVNGYFELSSNRRDIWRGDDMAGEGRTRAEWNQALLEDVVAPTYARLLLRLAQEADVEQLQWYYSIWPADTVAEPWLSLSRRVYVHSLNLPLLYSYLGPGKWVTPKEAVFVSDEWEAAEDVREALLADETPVVRLPDRLRVGFQNVAGAVRHATPEFMRRHFEAHPKFAAIRENRARMVRLLQYCLSDLILGCPPDTDGGEMYKKLCGLPIIPTADGGFKTVGIHSSSVKGSLFVATSHECELLGGVRGIIIDPALPAVITDHLRSDAMAAYTNVKTLTPQLLAACLVRVLPDGWKGLEEVQWRVGENGQPDAVWMRLFWDYVLNEADDRLPAFQSWPLVPTLEGTLCAMGDGDSKIVDGASVFGEKLKAVVSRLGVRMLNPEYISRRERLSSLVQRPNVRGLLRALGVANRGSFEHLCQRVGALPAADKRELRAFLLQRKWLSREECSDEATGMILALPVHEVWGVEEGKEGVEDVFDRGILCHRVWYVSFVLMS